MPDQKPAESTLAERLRSARENAGLSQGQIARMLEVHRPTISEIEAGRRKVSADELAQFARIYKVSLEWLTDSSPERDPRIELAARELSQLKAEDLEAVLRVLKTLESKRPR